MDAHRDWRKRLRHWHQEEINAALDGKYSAWIDASLMSGMNAFYEMWIRKKEDDENGQCIVHRKCK